MIYRYGYYWYLYNIEFTTVNLKKILVQAWIGPGVPGSCLPDFKIIGTCRWQGCQLQAPVAFAPQDIFLVLISVTGWANPKATGTFRYLTQKRRKLQTTLESTLNCSIMLRQRYLNRISLQWEYIQEKESLGIEGRIILKCVLKEQSMKIKQILQTV